MRFGWCYDPSSGRDLGRPQPGAVALRDTIASLEPAANVNYPYGIYASRPPSLHAEGRAIDIGFPGNCDPRGTTWAERLWAAAQDLGIQRIIWCHREIDSRPGQRTWQPYRGRSPHTDHIHVELCWAAARELTAEHARRVLEGRGDVGAAPREPHHHPTPLLRVHRGRGEVYHPEEGRWFRQGPGDAWWEFREVQQHLRELGYDPGPVDGIGGPRTDAAIRALQRDRGLKVDGIVGPQTWAHLHWGCT